MSFFTQSRYPRLWLLMQNMIGGNACKQALATEHYHGQKRVLEIGCSVGNISDAFRTFPDVDFTGIDIGLHAIDLAKQRFRNRANFSFSLNSLEELSRQGKNFDYVLFAGMFHHFNDNDGLRLLRDAVKCTANGVQLVRYEPEALKSSNNWFLRFFYAHFEQGVFLRSRENLLRLVERARITLQSVEDRMVGPGIVRRPYVARFNLLLGEPADKTLNAFAD